MTKRPNVLLFITDQHRADHLGCYGNEIVQTPNIDALAKRGKRYTRFYVANPVCMANRASLMTSRMPSAHGVYSNGAPLSVQSRTFVDRLSEEGYATALIGKSHLQTFSGRDAAFKPDPEQYHYGSDGMPSEAQLPNRRGVHYLNEDPKSWAKPGFEPQTPYYGFEHIDLVTGHADETGGHYEQWLRKQGGDWNELRGRKNAQPNDRIKTPQAWKTPLPEELYPTAYIGSQTVEYLESRNEGDAPFLFNVLSLILITLSHRQGRYWDMYDPDDIPLPPTWGDGDMPLEKHLYNELEKGTANRTSQMPYAVDERELREAIALTYGMITMIDDQVGRVMKALEESGEADNTIVIFTTDHGDYMGDRRLLLKGPLHLHGLLNVPFIWADPTNPIAETSDDLAQTIDIGPTILERVGVLPDYGVQGEPLTKRGETESLLVEDSRQRVNFGFDRFQGLRTLITKTHRLTVGTPDAGNEIFDLVNDPHEQKNLWDDPEHKDLQGDLMDALVRKMIALQDPIPLAPFTHEFLKRRSFDGYIIEHYERNEPILLSY